MPSAPHAIQTSSLLGRYRRTRARSRLLFDLIADSAYYSQPIALRHPIVFYEGHLPAFSFNTLVRRALGEKGIDAELEALFARGIDPDAPSDGRAFAWPSRERVRAFGDQADRRIEQALEREDLDRPGDALLHGAAAAHAIIEHEEMHQETLLYMWHRLPFDEKRRPAGYEPRAAGASPAIEWREVPGGRATLGVNDGSVPFCWDNECPSYTVDVPAFVMERHDVTNDRFLEFVDAGGYRDARWWSADDWAWITEQHIEHPLFWERDRGAWFWRGMFQRVPLPPAWPVFVAFAEAAAFARWRGARLPTEAEFQRAAYGSPRGERVHPWGDERPDARRGVFDFRSWDPEPAGSHPLGASAWGIEDLTGNGWEWTSTPFAPFPGFRAMAAYPEYSADFFDGRHFVLKGASPATASDLLRPTFRNWFRPRYPYVYATFRCANDRLVR